VPEELTRALVNIAFGALAGGLTNTIAIWMLFHPYRPPKIGRWEIGFLQGAIPKNQSRLAAAVGRTVGNRLLTEEDLAETFGNDEFRAAFQSRLGAFLHDVMYTERGAIRDLLPTAVLPRVEEIKDEIVEYGLERLDLYLDSEAFEESIGKRASEIVSSIADEPVADLLTPAREQAISTAIEDWLTSAVESDGFSEAVGEYLGRASEKLLEPGRTFEEVLPVGLVGTVEKGIAGYLPLAIQRLGSILEDQDARDRFERFVHDLLHRFLNDLKFHQQIVARLIMTESTVEKVLDTIEAEGAERLSEMLQEPELQDAMAKGVNDAIVDFLRRPVASVLGEPDDPSVLEARETLVEWLVGIAKDPATRQLLVEKLESGLEKAGARTWGEIFEKLPADTITEWLVKGARSDAARALYADAASRLVSNILDRPIGTPAHWLPEGAIERMESGVAEPVWDWLQTQVPSVVQQINVAKRVEDKVREFPTAKMEDLVRRVTDRELRVIVKLGYVLGGFIGVVLTIVNWIWPTG
jgi:uncharacterized membrane protein YheB (UPF0754 family)